MVLKRFLRFILKVEEYERRLLDGIPANENVEVYCSYYDNDSHHKIIWEDIYCIYHLAKEGTEEGIIKLQKDYQMKHDGYSVAVRLRTPIRYGKTNEDYYEDFTLEEVKRFYKEVLRNKEEKRKREIEEHNRKMEIERKNESKNLTDEVNKIMNDQ